MKDETIQSMMAWIEEVEARLARLEAAALSEEEAECEHERWSYVFNKSGSYRRCDDCGERNV